MERIVGSSDKLEPVAVEQVGARSLCQGWHEGNAPTDKAVGAMLDGNQLLGHPRRSHRGTHRGSGETGSPHSGPQLALGQMMNQEKYWWELGRQRKWQMYSVGDGGGGRI